MTSGLMHATCALTHVITADELEFVLYDEISLKEAMQSCCWWMLVEFRPSEMILRWSSVRGLGNISMNAKTQESGVKPQL